MVARIASYLFFALLIFSVSCKKEQGAVMQSGKIEHNIQAYFNTDTKTTLSGNTLYWEQKDQIGVSLENIQDNCCFECKSGDNFIGYFLKKDQVVSNVNAYAYYPFSYQKAPTMDVINGVLPHTQSAPFDSKADYMLADKLIVDYDESQLPDLDFTFSHHLFSILRVTIINSSSSLATEKVVGVKVSSKTKTMAGPFSFVLSDCSDAKPVFSTDESSISKSVGMSYATPKALQVNIAQTLDIVVPHGDYPKDDLSIEVYTESHCYSVVSHKAMNLEQGKIYPIQPIDVSTVTPSSGGLKTVVCFGDSITIGIMTEYLQYLLGCDWKVYLAGVGGNMVIPIMGRQGAAPLYIKGAFTIPASSNVSIEIGSTFYTTVHTNGDVSDIPDNPVSVTLQAYSEGLEYCGLTNPFKIDGIECNISSSNGKLYAKRVNNGEEHVCSGEFTKAIPFASWALGNPTLTTVYMGANGVYTENTAKKRTRDEVLTDLYGMVRDNTQGHFIAVGYHHIYWNASYASTMRSAFGANYVDLRTDGCTNASKIVSLLGTYLIGEDNTNIDNNIWPMTWGGLDTHPNRYGSRAYACLIYYKMKELGYVE